jgi:hypothetical protein
MTGRAVLAWFRGIAMERPMAMGRPVLPWHQQLADLPGFQPDPEALQANQALGNGAPERYLAGELARALRACAAALEADRATFGS